MIFETAASLLKEIIARGFDPRGKNGRDNNLYNKLKVELKCSTSIGLPSYLEKNKISASAFIAAFFRIAEPFSLMYRDIYAVMHQYGSKSGSETIKIRYNSTSAVFDIDLSDFKRWERIHKTIKRSINTRNWSRDDFWKLIQLFSKFVPRDFRDTNQKFIPGEMYTVCNPLKTGNGNFDNALNIIYNLLSNTIFELYEYKGSSKERIISSLSGQQVDSDLETKLPLLADSSFTYELLPLILNLYENLIEKIRLHSLDQSETKKFASSFYELLNDIEEVEIDQKIETETLKEILDLPFWKYRWYVFEIWTAMMSVNALSKYGIGLQLIDGTILPLSRGKESEIGQFKDQKGESYVLVAQQQTPISCVPGRKGICPDIRIVRGSGKLPGETIAIIECKQRATMDENILAKNVDIYEKGAPSSFFNLFVNYDMFPKLSSPPSRTILLSEFQPQRPDVVNQFKDVITSELCKAGILQPKQKYDALLIDISGSMRSVYSDPIVRRGLKEFLYKYEQTHIFFFNNDLSEPEEMPLESLIKSITSRISGGTSLAHTLETLRRKYPLVKRLVVLTDGDYGSVSIALSDQFDITESAPLNIGAM